MSIAQSPKSGADSDAPGTARALLAPGATLARLLAGAFLLAVVAFLVWGWRYQPPREDPWAPAGFWEWWLSPLPDPLYRSMPVTPGGAAGGFVPADLCRGAANLCPGLAVYGQHGLRLLAVESAMPVVLHRLAPMPEAHRLIGVSLAGILYERMKDLVWRPLPPIARQEQQQQQQQQQQSNERKEIVQSLAKEFAPPNQRQQDQQRVLPGQTEEQLPRSRLGEQDMGGAAVAIGAAPILIPSGDTSSVAFSPDGTRIASSGEDGAVRLWTLDGKPAAGPLQGEIAGRVSAVVFSPDGTSIASVGLDGTVRFWTLDGKPVAKPVSDNVEAALSVAFSPDGARIASAGWDFTVRLWAIDGKPAAGPFKGHTGSVLSVAFSPDGTRIASAGWDGTVRLWTLNGEPAAEPFKGHVSSVWSVAFSPDGRHIVSGGEDGTVRLWTLDGKPAAAPFNGHASSVRSVSFSPDGRHIVSGGEDGTVRLWMLDGKPAAEPFEIQRAASVAVSPDGAHIASAGVGGARLWTLAPWGFRASDIARAANGECLVVGAEGRVMRVDGDFQSWRPLATDAPVDLAATAAAGDDRFVAVGAGGTVLLVLAKDGPATVPKSLPTDLGRRSLNVVAFAKSQGWIGGAGGLIMTSADGGDSWTAQSVDTDADIRGLHIQPNGIGWAAARKADGSWVALRAADALRGPWQAIPQNASPAWYLAAAFLLPLAGFLNVMAWRPAPAAPVQSISSQGAPERPIDGDDPDPLRFKPLARGLSRFLRNINTEPPLTLAVTGRWGSGKSSLMNLLAEDLSAHGGRPVRFNAWHHREEQHLLAALFENIRAQAIPSGFTWPGLVFRVRLFALRSRRLMQWTAAGALFAAIAVAILWLGTKPGDFAPLQRLADATGREVLTELGKQAPDLGTSLVRWLAGLGGLGAAVLVVLWVRARITPLPAAAKLLASVARNARLADFRDQLGFRYRFGIALGEVCGLLRTGGSPGLVILIDDLDRCPPDDVTKILEAISFCVGAGPCIVVMGMDRRQVEFAVGEGFEKLVEGLPDEELDLEPGKAPDTKLRQQAFARRYLEKLVNIEVAVPRLDEEGLRRLLRPDVFVPAADEGPTWLPRVSAGARAVLQVSRVMFFAIIVGFALRLLLDHLPQPPAPPSVAASAPAGRVAAAPSTSAAPIAPLPAVQRPRVDPIAVDLPIRELGAEEHEGKGRWLWWGPLVALLAFSALWVVGIAARRRDQIVRDSPRFARALDAVEPLLTARLMTPRLVKRFQNRMRYLAERMRAQQPDTDWVAGLLHRVGRIVRRPLVPAAWFGGNKSGLIPEDVLILLGAVEQFMPRAFLASPSRFFANFQNSLSADQAGQEAWQQTTKDYREAGLEWPDESHIHIYRDIALSTLGDRASRQELGRTFLARSEP